MIVVIIKTDLYHSNPTGVKMIGEASAFVVVSVNLSEFSSFFSQSNSIKLYPPQPQKNNFCSY